MAKKNELSVVADCKKCHCKASLCVVKTKAGAFIVQPSIGGKRVCIPASRKGDWISPTTNECLGGIDSRFTLETLSRSIATAVKTSKGVVHMELSYVHMDARLSPSL